MASHVMRDLALLLQTLAPELNPGVQVFARLPLDADLAGLAPLASFREAEGLTVVLDEASAIRAGLPVLFRAAWITLAVHSDLAAVGLTAAVAGALAEAGIPCNVLAAATHDHLFVPVDSAQAAVARLQTLQRQAMDAVAAPA
jgi:hypothetical protein